MKIALSVALTVSLSMLAMVAAEHPEHPRAQTAAKDKPVDAKQAENAVKVAIDEASKGKAGYSFLDGKSGATIVLKLAKIRSDKPQKVGPGLFAIAAEFTGKDGAKYEFDFVVRAGEGSKVQVVDTLLRTENGSPRYGWKEQSGVLKAVCASCGDLVLGGESCAAPAAKGCPACGRVNGSAVCPPAKPKSEHPEHPH
jgi:hypothetical protein